MSRTLKLCIGGSTRRVNLFWSWWLTFKIDFEKKIQSLCGIWYYVLNKSLIILMTFGKTSNDEALCKLQDMIWDFWWQHPPCWTKFFFQKISAVYHKLPLVWIIGKALTWNFFFCCRFQQLHHFITFCHDYDIWVLWRKSKWKVNVFLYTANPYREITG